MILNNIRILIKLFITTLAITLSPILSAQALPPLKIIHLGDSYSAGNGARDSIGERNYHGVSGCFRSSNNWGNQFARSLRDVFSETYINRACSGGVIGDITNDRKMNSFDTTIERCPRPKFVDEEYWEITSSTSQEPPTFTCTRFLRPQIDAVDNSTDLIIMTGGGNDVGFEAIVQRCFATGLRDPDSCRTAVERANAELENVETNLISTFNALKNKMRPDAKIVFVTYPHLAPDVDYRIEEGEDIYEAAREIRALALEGDRRQRAAVIAANAAAEEEYIVFFDRTKELFEGHLPNPFQLRARNPDRWLHEFVLDPRFFMESYHYNPLGHQNLGQELSAFETFDAASGVFDAMADVDVAFVVDTTQSMFDELTQVQAGISNLVNQLATTSNSYRVAIVSYRDFVERTLNVPGFETNYPSRVDQTFTSDFALIQAAIDSLSARDGGDDPESVFSGIEAAIGLPWRPGVTKIVIVIGDAPALSPEPISGLTTTQIVADSIAVDPVIVIGVNTGEDIDSNLDSNGALTAISNGTGGAVVTGTSGLSSAISEVLDRAVNLPFAWIGQAYSGKIGEPIQFDASGSYDPSGLPLTLYEWDFDGDGTFDLETTEASATHIYNEEFDDFVILRVTGAGGTALASARTDVNAEGFTSQGGEEPCELDERGFSIIIDEEGRYISCTATNLPTVDKEGVIETSGASLEEALQKLKNATSGLLPKAFSNKYFSIKKAIDGNAIDSACKDLEGMSALAKAQTGKKISAEEASNVLEAVEVVKDILGC